MSTEPETDDRISPRIHADTDKLPVRNPGLTIAPDEQTVPQRSTPADPEQPTCAAVIRMMSSSFARRREH